MEKMVVFLASAEITAALTWPCAPRKFIRQGKKLGTSELKSLRWDEAKLNTSRFMICISPQLLGFPGISAIAQGLPAGCMDPTVVWNKYMESIWGEIKFQFFDHFKRNFTASALTNRQFL